MYTLEHFLIISMICVGPPMEIHDKSTASNIFPCELISDASNMSFVTHMCSIKTARSLHPDVIEAIRSSPEYEGCKYDDNLY